MQASDWLSMLKWSEDRTNKSAAIIIKFMRTPRRAVPSCFSTPVRKSIGYANSVYFAARSKQRFGVMTIKKDSWTSFSSMIHKKHRIERLNKTRSFIDKQISNRIWTIGHNASAADRCLLLLTAWLRAELCHPSMNGIAKFNWIAKNDHST